MKSAGRTIGILLLVQMVGMTVAFASMLSGTSSEFLSKAAGMDATFRVGILLLFITSGITVAMSVIAFPVLREYGVRTAIALVVAGTLWAAVQAIDNAHLMSMLSLSHRYTEAGGANADVYNMLAASTFSTRRSIHYTELLIVDIWFVLFYGALFAFRLVPRWLGALGLLAAALHIFGLPLAMFAGYPLMTPLAYGLGLSYLVFGVWLIVKGFANHEVGGS